jgi:hypothetical protein
MLTLEAKPKEITASYRQLEVLARLLSGVPVSPEDSLLLDKLRKQVFDHLNAN